MDELILLIGNRNYSSWSLRPWLVLKAAGIPFREEFVPLWQDGSTERIAEFTPAGKVPALRHGDIAVWESLAICEYAAELFPEAGLWPADAAARAHARAISHEMHGGFQPLRREMPMNCRADKPGKGMGEGVADNIRRITEIWRDCRTRFGAGGDMLFGGFTIADAMFAPVVSRLRTYGVEVDPVSRAYMSAVMGLRAMGEWYDAARAEPYVVEAYEI